MKKVKKFKSGPNSTFFVLNGLVWFKQANYKKKKSIRQELNSFLKHFLFDRFPVKKSETG